MSISHKSVRLSKTLVCVAFIFCIFAGCKDTLFVSSCKEDLNTILKTLQQHSAAVKNEEDKLFQNWLLKGYNKSIRKCDTVSNIHDIFLVLKFFTEGFKDPHIRINSNKNAILSTYREIGISNLENGVWIRVPTFAPKNDKEADKLKKIFQSLRDLRNKEFIVFDLSGNGGGSSIWQKPLLRNLWGDKYLRSLGDLHVYNQEWSKKLRISDENLQHLKKLGYPIRKENKDFDIIKFDMYSYKENLYSSEDDVLVSAKIFVLTDSLCASSCWLNVREFLQVPGVVHIGDTTAIQTLYSEVRRIMLPSRNFTFIFPIHQFLSPLNNIGKAFEPAIHYKGDFSNERAKQVWFLSEVLNKRLKS